MIQLLALRGIENGVVIIEVPNAQVKSGIERRYTRVIKDALVEALGQDIQLKIVTMSRKGLMA